MLTPIAMAVGLLTLNLDAIQSLSVGCLSGMLAQEFSDSSASFVSIVFSLLSK